MQGFHSTLWTCLLIFVLTGQDVTAFASSYRTATTTTKLMFAPQNNGLAQRNKVDVFSSLGYSPKSATDLHMMISSPSLVASMIPRGGAATFSSLLTKASASPQSVFNSALIALAFVTASLKIVPRLATSSGSGASATIKEKPASVKSLQLRFLSVFWLLRCADWLQGPYFYEVYASKVFNGAAASMGLVSRLFLTGFASTALFGPAVGRAADSYGRKKATLAFSVIYAAGALATKSPLLAVLFCGRILSGIGTSLLFSAPESWLVGESQKGSDDPDGSYLGETFGLAYAGDSLVAIAAGQMAGLAASRTGPTGPFQLSAGFLALGGVLTALLWKENKAETSSDGSGNDDKKPTIRDAVQVVKKDPKIMLVGAVQSLFEAAMYIFVLQWPPAIAAAIKKAFSGSTVPVPYGTVFSCFMASCLLGSTLFGQLANAKVDTETSTSNMLLVATLAMVAATWTVGSGMTMLGGKGPLMAIVAAFFAFEACVGMYFPSIGTLRSKYVPDSHRSVIMNLFGIPLNVLVVTVFLSISKLGVTGALGISSAALAVATACMVALRNGSQKEAVPSVA